MGCYMELSEVQEVLVLITDALCNKPILFVLTSAQFWLEVGNGQMENGGK